MSLISNAHSVPRRFRPGAVAESVRLVEASAKFGDGDMSVFDVAAYILRERGPMTAMKLQKLVYYSQAWSLVWDERPLFEEPIEAWANGPVCPRLYSRHRGQFMLKRNAIAGDPSALDEEACETVDAVLGFYGQKTAQWLSDLTHREAPWLEARSSVGLGERGDEIISHASMAEYYLGLNG